MNKDLGLIGRYELQRPLGRGSLAEVWKAFDTRLKRSVALKLLHSDLQVDPNFITRFEREMPVISSLGHPNIVQIFDYQVFRPRGSDNLKAYIVMNYVKGRTLADYIRHTSRAGQFPSAADMVHLFMAAGVAIDYAHQHGVIHADIKPSNTLLATNLVIFTLLVLSSMKSVPGSCLSRARVHPISWSTLSAVCRLHLPRLTQTSHRPHRMSFCAVWLKIRRSALPAPLP